MKILCCAYRDWAKNIYNSLEKHFIEHTFIRINSKEDLDSLDLNKEGPDLILWYGWSWIIPEDILKRYYSVMLHPSPLPKYRGGSPVQNQIVNGEETSAVTLFKMDGGIDTGDIIGQKHFSLTGDLNDVFDKITEIGISLSHDMIKNFDSLTLIPQDHSQATYFKRRKPSQSEITLEDLKYLKASEIHNKIRALQDPYPNAFIVCKDGTRLYITKSHL